MIRLSIKNQEEPTKEKECEGVLRLKQKENGDVDLIMEDQDGCEWYIVKIRTNGTLMKHECLPDYIGLQVDSDGKIIEGDSDDS